VTTGLSYLRTRRRLALLVLPALLLRALIPLGFMPVAAGGALAIGFCPGEGPMPSGLAGHAHHAGEAAGGRDALHHGPCLFASGATATFASVPAAALPATPGVTAPGQRTALRVFVPAILRTQFSRAPPPGA
jgi:hypothetical protein